MSRRGGKQPPSLEQKEPTLGPTPFPAPPLALPKRAQHLRPRRTMPQKGPSMDASKKVDLKIIIIGALGVGKTSLLHQYVHQTFYEDYRTTLGASILTKVIAVDKTPLKLQVSKEIASAWCKEKDIPYFEVSAKNNINVAEAFETLAKQALTTYKGIYESYLTNSIKLTPEDKPTKRCC
uniref:RAB7B, member RAS oncogene family n=1 Tax=Chrysolophus pictus TaxID=9089 RepID=A0A8C3KXK8_CHRPC